MLSCDGGGLGGFLLGCIVRNYKDICFKKVWQWKIIEFSGFIKFRSEKDQVLINADMTRYVSGAAEGKPLHRK